MLVILKESIRTLGKVGQVIKVKPGYARNFLFPQKKAVRANEDNLIKLKEERSILEEESEKKLNAAKELALSFNGKFIILVKQASEDGRIFGSVTTREIAKVLSDESYVTDHRKLSLNGISIKNLGEYQVILELHSDVVVPIAVHVVKSETDANELKKIKLQTQVQGEE